MPWHIEEQDDEYCVIQDDTGEVERCYPNRDDALALLRALYANVEEASKMLRRSFPFELKSLDDQAGVFEGHAAVFGNVDEGGDVIEAGAFAKTLQERGQRVKICWQHDWREPIGKPLELREDAQGLFVKARLSDTQRGRDALTLLRDGVVDELSFGYETIKSEWGKDGDGQRVRLLKELRLYEISPVTAAMNEQARISAVKAAIPEVKFAGSPRNRYGTHASYGFKGDYAAAWRCHFSKVGGGSASAEATGPIRGTVRRCAMIAAAMKPACELISTESVEARKGPRSPLECSFPSKPSDYGLSEWDKPEGEEGRKKAQLSCSDLNVIKKAALAEIKRRAEDREAGGKAVKQDDDRPSLVHEDPLWEDQEAVLSGLTEESNISEEEALGQLFESIAAEPGEGPLTAQGLRAKALELELQLAMIGG